MINGAYVVNQVPAGVPAKVIADVEGYGQRTRSIQTPRIDQPSRIVNFGGPNNPPEDPDAWMYGLKPPPPPPSAELKTALDAPSLPFRMLDWGLYLDQRAWFAPTIDESLYTNHVLRSQEELTDYLRLMGASASAVVLPVDFEVEQLVTFVNRCGTPGATDEFVAIEETASSVIVHHVNWWLGPDFAPPASCDLKRVVAAMPRVDKPVVFARPVTGYLYQRPSPSPSTSSGQKPVPSKHLDCRKSTLWAGHQ